VCGEVGLLSVPIKFYYRQIIEFVCLSASVSHVVNCNVIAPLEYSSVGSIKGRAECKQNVLHLALVTMWPYPGV